MRSEESFGEPSSLDYPHSCKHPNRNGPLEKPDNGSDDRIRRLRHQKRDEPRDNAAQQTKHQERDHKIRYCGKTFLRRLATDPVAGLHKPMQRRKGEISHGKRGDKPDERPQLARKTAKKPHYGEKRRYGQQNPI